MKVTMLVFLVLGAGTLAAAPPAKADGRPLMGYGLNLRHQAWNLQAYNMSYDINGCAQLCENDGRCVAWPLQGDGSQARYTCRQLDSVQGAPRPMSDTFFGLSSRYR